MTETSHNELFEAMQRVRLKVGKLPKDGRNPHFHNRYTTLETLTERVLPALDSEGLSWITLPGVVETVPVLHYEMVHRETNQRAKGQMPLILAKQDPQGLGSALTYARRYALITVLNLLADEDDDGRAASATTTSDEPASQTRTLAQLAYGKSLEQLAWVFRQAGLEPPPDPMKTLSGPIPDNYYGPLEAALLAV